MNPRKALDILNQATASIQASRNEHAIILESLESLDNFVSNHMNGESVQLEDED